MVILRQYKPEFTIYASLITGALILALVFTRISGIIDLLGNIASKSSFNNHTYNEKYFINSIININTYTDYYSTLHKELCSFYGDETEKAFSDNFLIIKEFIENENLSKKQQQKLINDFKIFSELKNKKYDVIISYYLNNYNFAKFLYCLLNKKEINIYKKIGYFAGNLMYCLVEYGKKEKKGVNIPNMFYSGIQLNIIEILELLKNKKSIITFPYFFHMTTKRQIAEISSKRNISDEKRKEKNLFSVIIKIDYLYDEEYEPSCFELKHLSPFPEEEEYIVLPFTFYIIDKITIDCDKYISDIEMRIIG